MRADGYGGVMTQQCHHCGSAVDLTEGRCPQCLRKLPAMDMVPDGGAMVLEEPLSPPKNWPRKIGIAMTLTGLTVLAAWLVALTDEQTHESDIPLLVGLFLVASPLVFLPAFRKARSEGKSLKGASGRGLLRVSGVTAAILTIWGIKTITYSEPIAPLPTPETPKASTTPLGLKNLQAERAWRVKSTGHLQLHIASEAQPFERSILKLKTELMDALAEFDQKPDADPVITLWVPASFENEATRAAADREATALNEVMARSRRTNRRGEAIQIVIAFGDIPSS